MMKIILALATTASLSLSSCSHVNDEDLAKAFELGAYTAGRIIEINAQK